MWGVMREIIASTSEGDSECHLGCQLRERQKSSRKERGCMLHNQNNRNVERPALASPIRSRYISIRCFLYGLGVSIGHHAPVQRLKQKKGSAQTKNT